MTMKLTLQCNLHSGWHDLGELTLNEPEKGRRSSCAFNYSLDYLTDICESFDSNGIEAASCLYATQLMTTYRKRDRWFSFLDDIVPSGASRRWWVSYLNMQHLSEAEQDTELLKQGTIAPVGNLRIKESVPKITPEQASQRYEMRHVVDRDSDFLQYAGQLGAASGGATGAGGEAPKLLIRLTHDKMVWIDSQQDDPNCLDTHYLVKFARGKRSPRDKDILRAEYHYYHELHALGFETIDTQNMHLIEGDKGPSLWLPRFDVGQRDGKLERYGLESISSLMDVPFGATLDHNATIRAIVRILKVFNENKNLPSENGIDAFVKEWVKRDFLNICFGNSDNHGRNSSILKKPDHIALAPIYDFAPMKADDEGIVRVTTWQAPLEIGGNYKWREICSGLSDLIDGDVLFEELRLLGKKLRDLRSRLEARGVSTDILDLPTLGFRRLETLQVE